MSSMRAKQQHTPAISRLRELRKAKGLSQARLAKLVGASQPDIARLERGGRRLTTDWMRRIAAALEVHPADLLEPEEPWPGRRSDVLRAVTPGFGPDEVTVYGYAIAGEDDCIDLANRSGIGRVLRHPRQHGVAEAFAAYVAGTSMVPRYRPGELVYAIPGRWPAAGEDCIVELKGGYGFLKEFRERTAAEIVCWQHHPPGEWRRPLAEVVAVHSVVGRG